MCRTHPTMLHDLRVCFAVLILSDDLQPLPLHSLFTLVIGSGSAFVSRIKP